MVNVDHSALLAASAERSQPEFALDVSPYAINVFVPTTWAQRHLRFLEAVFEAFDESGIWPQAEDLHRKLLRHDEELDVGSLASQMPAALGFLESGRIVLLVRGLSHVPAASRLLDAYVSLLRVAFQRYLGTGVNPRISNTDVEHLGLEDSDGVKVARLVYREGWPFGNGSGEPEGAWHRDITSQVAHIRNVHTVEDVLAKRAELLWGPPPPPPPEPPRLSRRERVTARIRQTWVWRFFGSEDRTIGRKVAAGVITALAIAGILAIARVTFYTLKPAASTPQTFGVLVANVCEASDFKMSAITTTTPSAAAQRAQLAALTARQLKVLAPQAAPDQRVSFDDYVVDRYRTASIRNRIANSKPHQQRTRQLIGQLQHAEYEAEADAKLAGISVCGERAPLE